MGYFRRLLVAAVGGATLVGAGSLSVGASDTLVQFDSMTGVTQAQTNTFNDRGIQAGGAPWVITSGTGEVDRQGNLEVQVSGLIIPILTPPHNPVPSFTAVVSCLTPGGVATNVLTGPVGTGSTGDAMFATQVALPHPCKSPEVFVGFVKPPAAGQTVGQFIWFAQSNAEGDD